jgi:hypothetical protein
LLERLARSLEGLDGDRRRDAPRPSPSSRSGQKSRGILVREVVASPAERDALGGDHVAACLQDVPQRRHVMRLQPLSRPAAALILSFCRNHDPLRSPPPSLRRSWIVPVGEYRLGRVRPPRARRARLTASEHRAAARAHPPNGHAAAGRTAAPSPRDPPCSRAPGPANTARQLQPTRLLVETRRPSAACADAAWACRRGRTAAV